MTVSWDHTSKRWVMHTARCHGPFHPNMPPRERETGRVRCKTSEIFHCLGWREDRLPKKGRKLHLWTPFPFWWLCEQCWFDFLWRLVTMSPPLSLLFSASTSLKFHGSLLFLPLYTTHTDIQTHVRRAHTLTHKAVPPQYMTWVQYLLIILSPIVLLYWVILVKLDNAGSQAFITIAELWYRFLNTMTVAIIQ